MKTRRPWTDEMKKLLSDKIKRQYENGRKSWNTGIGHSFETREKMSRVRKERGTSLPQLEVLRKMSEGNRGKHLSDMRKEFLSRINKGKKLSSSTKDKISLSKREYYKTHIHPCVGRKISKETREKIRKAHIGKIMPTRGKTRPELSGENHWNWRGGISSKNETVRKSLEIKLWRKAVFERDKYSCVIGGKEHGNKLHADHIKPFALYPDLRFAIDNGRTLCEECHRKTDTYAGRIHGMKSPIILIVK